MVVMAVHFTHSHMWVHLAMLWNCPVWPHTHKCMKICSLILMFHQVELFSLQLSGPSMILTHILLTYGGKICNHCKYVGYYCLRIWFILANIFWWQRHIPRKMFHDAKGIIKQCKSWTEEGPTSFPYSQTVLHATEVGYIIIYSRAQ
jgi:hypothetical protein